MAFDIRSCWAVVFVVGLLAAPSAGTALAQTPAVRSDQPSADADVAAIAAKVTALGVGKRVVVQTTNAGKLTGHIASIASDQFTLLPDKGPLRDVRHTDVRSIKPKMSAFSKTVVFAAVGVGAMAAIGAVLSHVVDQ